MSCTLNCLRSHPLATKPENFSSKERTSSDKLTKPRQLVPPVIFKADEIVIENGETGREEIKKKKQEAVRRKERKLGAEDSITDLFVN